VPGLDFALLLADAMPADAAVPLAAAGGQADPMTPPLDASVVLHDPSAAPLDPAAGQLPPPSATGLLLQGQMPARGQVPAQPAAVEPTEPIDAGLDQALLEQLPANVAAPASEAAKLTKGRPALAGGDKLTGSQALVRDPATLSELEAKAAPAEPGTPAVESRHASHPALHAETQALPDTAALQQSMPAEPLAPQPTAAAAEGASVSDATRGLLPDARGLARQARIDARADAAADLAADAAAAAVVEQSTRGAAGESFAAQLSWASTGGPAGVAGAGSAASAIGFSAPANQGPTSTGPAEQPGATTASAVLETPFDSPDFAPALGARVSVLASNGIEQAELHLNPRDMGPISVQIALDGQLATVHFGADVSATRSALESSWPQLASALSEAGFTLAGGGVSEQSGRREPREGAAAQGQAAGTPSRPGDEREPQPAVLVPARRTRGVVDLVA
jgi:flagellar hook-length control protein FliK